MPTYRDPGPVEFDAPIRLNPGGGAYFEFPFDVEELYGVRGRVPMKATYDGIAYRGSLAKMGPGCHLVPILKEIRERLGKSEGDLVHVTVELDDAPRTVEVPADAKAALRDADLLAAFERLSFTHRREHVMAIDQAKRPETRQRRVSGMIDMLRGD